MKDFKIIGKPIDKVDSLGHALGREMFVDDFPLQEALIAKMLYSPHAFAKIVKIDTEEAEKVDGVICIYHYENTEQILHTTAGQGFPEPSPYDSVMFDNVVRFVGDNVAMVVAESEKIADLALSKIKVTYEEFEPLLDPEKAMDKDAPIISREDSYVPLPVKFDRDSNLAAEVEIGFGDVEEACKKSDFIIEHTYNTQYASHCAIEPHSVTTQLDSKGRLIITTATQVPFHVRRIVSKVLQIPAGKIRVIKPRIGGGFGGKQEVFLEPLCGLATLKTGRPVKLILSREEVFVSSRTRHPMRTKLKMAFDKDGTINAVDMDCLMNTGAYGSHALTVLGNGGAKVLPLFNKIDNMHFLGRTVYTNLPVGGAYRGYGATQTYFGYNQHLDMIAEKCELDFLEFCKKWHIKKGETSKVFEALGEGKEGIKQIVKSCKLTECIDEGAKEIGWYDKRKKKLKNGDKVTGVGLAISMQGSSIPLIDMGSAYMKINDDGSFNLSVGATDIGTGSDTILAQIAAESLGVTVDKIIVLSSDTDTTPFDVGAYASSTTYISGQAVFKCAEKIKDTIKEVAAKMLDANFEELYLDDCKVFADSGKSVGLDEIAVYSLYSRDQFQIQAHASSISHESPPPFAAGFAEVEVDTKTGKVEIKKFVSAVDCGMPLNPVLVEGQMEGAVINGINYACWEEYLFSSKGKMKNSTFWDYKFYTTMDMPEMSTIVMDSYEETGPYGAKSVGEIGINLPMPAIANAIYDAVGVRMFEAPFTSERVLEGLKSLNAQK